MCTSNLERTRINRASQLHPQQNTGNQRVATFCALLETFVQCPKSTFGVHSYAKRVRSTTWFSLWEETMNSTTQSFTKHSRPCECWHSPFRMSTFSTAMIPRRNPGESGQWTCSLQRAHHQSVSLSSGLFCGLTSHEHNRRSCKWDSMTIG